MMTTGFRQLGVGVVKAGTEQKSCLVAEEGRGGRGDGDFISNSGDTCEKRKHKPAENDGSQAEILRKMTILKRPLTFWYLKNENTREWNWKLNQVPLVTVKTQEDYWLIHNYLEVASKLDDGCDYSVFKQGIFPDWEHNENMDGGRWIITVDKVEVLDGWWQKLLTIMLEENMLVNGVVVSKRRKGDKMAVWLRDASHQEEVMRVGRLVKDMLRIDGRVQFNVHKNFMGKKMTLLQYSC